MLDINTIKKDFPIFKENPDLVYLDSTATSLKPQCVLNKLVEYYTQYSANIYRGIYKISEKATEEYENSRQVVAKFINANFPQEVIFTRNTTESINLVAYSLGRKIIEKGDEIIISMMEHHSNFVPWQQLAFENEALLKVLEINDQGELQGLDNLDQIITKKTKILALTHVSNVLGTVNPVKEIISRVKRINLNTIIIVDGAQAAPHVKVDVQDLNCDFYAFSSHKMLGPTGVGVLWGKSEILDEMYPFLYGGEMVEEVHLNQTSYKKSPEKFEAGTPHIAGVIALKEAVQYLNDIGLINIHNHEKELTSYCLSKLQGEFGREIKILGPKRERAAIISFTYENIHPHDVAQVLNEEEIAIRAGHHCAMPLHQYLKVPASARASFYLYNSLEDVDKFIEGLKKVQKIL